MQGIASNEKSRGGIQCIEGSNSLSKTDSRGCRGDPRHFSWIHFGTASSKDRDFSWPHIVFFGQSNGQHVTGNTTVSGRKQHGSCPSRCQASGLLVLCICVYGIKWGHNINIINRNNSSHNFNIFPQFNPNRNLKCSSIHIVCFFHGFSTCHLLQPSCNCHTHCTYCFKPNCLTVNANNILPVQLSTLCFFQSINNLFLTSYQPRQPTSLHFLVVTFFHGFSTCHLLPPSCNCHTHCAYCFKPNCLTGKANNILPTCCFCHQQPTDLNSNHYTHCVSCYHTLFTNNILPV